VSCVAQIGADSADSVLRFTEIRVQFCCYGRKLKEPRCWLVRLSYLAESICSASLMLEKRCVKLSQVWQIIDI